jgi:deoxyribodipyrimidine photolyase-related protein
VPAAPRFAPAAITREVLSLVARRFASHPGERADFHRPVTATQAYAMLDACVTQRLAGFGPWQDAMWSDRPWLWHSLLSTSLNLHLLDPRRALATSERAYREGRAGIASVEGFVRQVLGWREFIRGVYWLTMPGLREANHYWRTRPLPGWYWTGGTRMNCMRQVIGQVLRHGFANHIQRLMITGQSALLAGLSPQAVEDWYVAMFVDAVEWVELPNTAGMALHADGGRFTSKPCVASGQYVKLMSNYCAGCRYRPEVRTGPHACPMTTLYWGFLDREHPRLAANPRTALMAQSVARLAPDARAAIRDAAARVQDGLEAV